MKNWTEARALRATNLRLRKVRTLLEETAYLWGEVDNYAVTLCDELYERTEEVRLEIVASAQTRVEEREAAQ